MVVFSSIFVADTKIIFRYDFVAPLSDWLTTIFFNFWKNQKYQFIINLFTSLLQMKLFKSSQQRCSVKKGFLRNFAEFTGKHLCQSLFFTQVAAQPATLLKKRLWHRCFPENFAKFLRTPFFKEHLQWLLLILQVQSCI